MSRCGVSRTTFYQWRCEGRIPEPDIAIPGVLRWSVGLVERTMRGFRRPKVGRPVFGRKSETFQRERARR